MTRGSAHIDWVIAAGYVTVLLHGHVTKLFHHGSMYWLIAGILNAQKEIDLNCYHESVLKAELKS